MCSLDERALLVRCEFVVVAGEHDNGSVDVALREYRRGGYRVAVDALDGVEPLILAGAVNVALALLDEVLQGAGNPALNDLLFRHSGHGDNVVAVADNGGTAAYLRQHVGVLRRRAGYLPDRGVLLENDLPVGAGFYIYYKTLLAFTNAFW